MVNARIFVISDTHFHHENIYKFVLADKITRVRPEFEHASEADVEMIRRWNAIVTIEDHVYHIGDVTMGNNLSLIAQLNGHKRLILGNHDKCDVRQYREAGFQKVYGSRQFDRWCILTHIPVHPQSIPKGGINIHGHLHRGLVMESPHHPDPRYRNVCVEQIDYTPVLLESLKP